SFPVKGVSFQLSLYLLPVLILAFRHTRLLLKRNSSTILCLFICFSLPLFLSELWSSIFNGVALSGDPFEIFWRLALFPLVLVAACDYSHFSLRWLQNSFVLFAVIYGTVGIAGLLLHTSLNGRPLGARAVGVINNPNPFGLLMIVAFLICFQRLFETVSKKEIFIFLPACLLLLTAGVLSGSRSTLLGGVLGLMLLLFLQREDLIPFFVNKNKLLIFSGSIMLLFILAWLLWHSPLSYLPARIIGVFDGDTRDVRLQIWQHYLGFVRENPLLGTSFGAENRFHLRGQVYYGPHNMYLSVLVHSGIIGLSGLLLGLGLLIKRAISLKLHDRSLCLALLLLLCVFCFFNAPLYGNEMSQGVFAMIVIMIVGGDSLAKE
ncbi:MAG: hypothetical protein DRH07_11575, partial [Deltaproteobacteria bacterium]